MKRSQPVKEFDLKTAKYENLERTALCHIYVVILLIFIFDENESENKEISRETSSSTDNVRFYFFEWFYKMKNRLSNIRENIFGW